MNNTKLILQEILTGYNITLTLSEAKEAFQAIEDRQYDCYIEIDGMEFRLIEEGAIWDIYVETIKNICEDCYEVTLPTFMQDCIDWEKVAYNCYIDGYGHTFSSYDGGELEAGNYYIFRTN